MTNISKPTGTPSVKGTSTIRNSRNINKPSYYTKNIPSLQSSPTSLANSRWVSLDTKKWFYSQFNGVATTQDADSSELKSKGALTNPGDYIQWIMPPVSNVAKRKFKLTSVGGETYTATVPTAKTWDTVKFLFENDDTVSVHINNVEVQSIPFTNGDDTALSVIFVVEEKNVSVRPTTEFVAEVEDPEET